jgi:hypothetical protein
MTTCRQCVPLTLAFLMQIASPSYSQVKNTMEVPTELFGITIGKAYSIGEPENGDLGNFPVKKFAGIQKFMGSGVSYYFQPIKANPAFEYIEERKTPEDKFFATSFRAYIYPVIPPDIQSLKELEQNWMKFKHRVTLVEWSKDMPNENDAYYAAMDWCATFKATISVDPKITDLSPGTQWYRCEFTSGDRVLEARNVGKGVSVALRLREDITDKINADVEERVRSLQGKALLE